jgi:hypothetical protein
LRLARRIALNAPRQIEPQQREVIRMVLKAQETAMPMLSIVKNG